MPVDVSAAPARERSEEVQTATFPAGLRTQNRGDLSEFAGVLARMKAYLDASQAERRGLGRAFGVAGARQAQGAGSVLRVREEIARAPEGGREWAEGELFSFYAQGRVHVHARGPGGHAYFQLGPFYLQKRPINVVRAPQVDPASELRCISCMLTHPLNKRFLVPFFAGGGVGVVNLGAAERTGLKLVTAQHLGLLNGRVVAAAFTRASQLKNFGLVCFLDTGRAVSLAYADQRFRATGGAIFAPPGRRTSGIGAKQTESAFGVSHTASTPNSTAQAGKAAPESGRTLTAAALTGAETGGKVSAAVGFEDGVVQQVEFAGERASEVSTAEDLAGYPGSRTVSQFAVRPPVRAISPLDSAVVRGLAAHFRAALRRCVLVLDGAGALGLFAGRECVCRYVGAAPVRAFGLAGRHVVCLVGGRRVSLFPLFPGGPVSREALGLELESGLDFEALEVVGADAAGVVVLARTARGDAQLASLAFPGALEAPEDVGRRLFWAVQGDE